MSRLRSLPLLLPLLAAALIGAPPAAGQATSPRASTPAPPQPDLPLGIEGLSPNHGPAGGGTRVTLTVPAQGPVLFGTKPATVINTTITQRLVLGTPFNFYTYVVEAPAGTAGSTVDVTVGGTGGNTPALNDYTYDAVDRTPGIQSVSPNIGPALGGNTVRVSTRSSSGAVLFGGKPATVISTAVGDDFENAIAYYSYEVKVPAGLAGTTVEVTVGGRGGVTATSNDYTYDRGDTTTPDPSKAQCGAAFSIYYPLVNVQAPTVTIAGKVVSSKQSGQALEFSPPSPDYAAGPSYPVAVDGLPIGTYRDRCFSAGPGFFGAPTVLGISKLIPASGPTAGGEQVVAVVDGDVAADAVLYFGDQPGLESRVSPNRVLCIPEVSPCGSEQQRGWLVSAKAPPGTSGWINLSVRSGSTVFRGQAATLDDYEYVAPPSIASLTPAGGPLVGGNVIVAQLAGDYLRDPQVAVGGRAASAVSTSTSLSLTDGSYGEQQLRFTVPAGAAAGKTALTITGFSGLGLGETTATADYTYDAPATSTAPAISSVLGSGVTGLGGLIVVRGTNLAGLRSLRVGSRTATVLSKSSTLLFAFVPSLPKGAYPVIVTTKGGTTTAAAKYTFR